MFICKPTVTCAMRSETSGWTGSSKSGWKLNLALFDFTEQDLISNRRGQLTPPQKEWLAGMGQGIRRMSQFNARIAFGFLIFGSCLIFGLWMSNEDSRAAFFANPVNLFVLPETAIIVIGILALSLYFAGRMANKLSAPQVQLAEGKVRLDEDSSGNTGGTTYLAYIGRKKFAFGESVSHIFQEGTRYRVYYVRAGVLEFVLSYEKLP